MPKACQQLQSDVDVGLGDEVADHLNGDVTLGGQRSSGRAMKQRGQELAGHIAAHLDRRLRKTAEIGRGQSARVGSRGCPGSRCSSPAGAGHRPDRQSGHSYMRAMPVIWKWPPEHRQRSGQWAHGRARHCPRETRWRQHRPATAPQAGDAQRRARRLHLTRLHTAAQGVQRIQHNAGVVRIQQIVQSVVVPSARGPQAAAPGWKLVF